MHILCYIMQEERSELMQQVQELDAQVKAQATELQQYAENDPETLARLLEATEVCATLRV